MKGADREHAVGQACAYVGAEPFECRARMSEHLAPNRNLTTATRRWARHRAAARTGRWDGEIWSTLGRYGSMTSRSRISGA
jgi:hypothetical protein